MLAASKSGKQVLLKLKNRCPFFMAYSVLISGTNLSRQTKYYKGGVMHLLLKQQK